MAVPKLAAVKKSPFEKSVEEGEVRSIGLSNWYIKELTDFLPKVDVIPALVQNEIHPFYQDRDVVPFIQEQDGRSDCAALESAAECLRDSRIKQPGSH